MLSWAIPIAMGIFALAMALTLYRMVKGPDITDRVLALDTLMINGIALLVLTDIRLGLGILFEVGMLIALMGFVSTVALSKYLLRGDVIE